MGRGGRALMVKVFKCLFCESCCLFERESEMPTVFPWEKRLLEEYSEGNAARLAFKPILVYRDGEGNCVIVLYRWLINGYCPFYDRGTGKCKIHDSKPLACRMYPLILELPSGRLLASQKCEWVRRQGSRLLHMLSKHPELIPRVFPSEFKAVREVFTEINNISRFLEERGMQRVDSVDSCNKVFDVDDYMARFG
ncbi:MAG: hypothetical protein DSY37_04650 [Hyperthermus sp.]|nr:MAG: hypothetical protein DSY37_04650 [Hyperthermus sp.]